jgi:hypothetical protein
MTTSALDRNEKMIMMKKVSKAVINKRGGFKVHSPLLIYKENN